MSKLERVELASIDWVSSQRCFCLRMGRDTAGLRESIRDRGQITPLVLRDGRGGKHELVCGFGRVEAMRALGTAQATAQILPSSTTDLDCLLLALHDNAYGRGFNVAEAASALVKLREAGCAAPMLRSEVAPLLGLPRSDKVVASYVQIAALPSCVHEALAKGSMRKEHALALCELDEQDRVWFCEHVLARAECTASELKEICARIVELKIRESSDIQGVLAQAGWSALVATAPNHRHAAQALRAALARARFPALTSAEEAYARAARAMRLPAGASLCHSPHFEDDAVTLRARLSTVAELEALGQALLSACGDGRGQRVLQAARGEQPDDTSTDD